MMSARQLVAYFADVGPQDPCFYPQYLAEHLYEFRLRDGHRIFTADDVQMFLLELSEACRQPVVFSGIAQPQSAPLLEMRTGPKFLREFNLEEVCRDCGHVHETDQCCGEDMGNRMCTCRRQVRA